MNCVSHCLENFTRRRPESLRSEVSGFKTSEANRVRRLIMSCSVEGIYPLDKARSIW